MKLSASISLLYVVCSSKTRCCFIFMHVLVKSAESRQESVHRILLLKDWKPVMMVFFYFSCAVTDCCSDPSLPLFCHWAQKHLTGTSLPSLTSLTPSLGLWLSLCVRLVLAFWFFCFELNVFLRIQTRAGCEIQIFSELLFFFLSTNLQHNMWLCTIKVSLPNTGQLWFLCFPVQKMLTCKVILDQCWSS